MNQNHSLPLRAAFHVNFFFLSSSTMKAFTPQSMSSQNVPALHALALESGPHFLWRPLSSTLIILGLMDDFKPPLVSLPPLVACCVVDLDGVCGSLADLAGPPLRPPRGFLRGSPADLSGPPRRGPRGVTPRGCLFFQSSCRRHWLASMTATGGPLLGKTRDLQSQGPCPLGCSWFLPLSCCRKNVAGVAAAGDFFGTFLAAD